MPDDLQQIVREAVGLTRGDIAASLRHQAELLRIDTLENQMPRIADGLTKGYPDDAQMLLAFAQLIRTRTLIDTAKQIEDGQH